MNTNRLTFEQKDFIYLKGLLNISKYNAFSEEGESLKRLEQEVKKAEVFEEYEISKKVIRFNSVVSIEINERKKMKVQIVKSVLRDLESNKISVLTPLGSVLIGNKEGDVVEWHTPSGVRNIKIVHVAQKRRHHEVQATYDRVLR
ncbi:MAG: GreA/GreB family elongation factor [Flavobacteriales bacterium]|nr:GreA/GreB family elongation factor [Flavobacteriales bacterium]